MGNKEARALPLEEIAKMPKNGSFLLQKVSIAGFVTDLLPVGEGDFKILRGVLSDLEENKAGYSDKIQFFYPQDLREQVEAALGSRVTMTGVLVLGPPYSIYMTGIQ